MNPKKYHFIYKTTCLTTGRFYIGMHSTDDKDDLYLGSGKLLLRSIKKYGREKHVREIIEELPDRESLRLREAEIVTLELVKNRRCMNAVVGGTGGTMGMDDRVLAGLKAHAERIKTDPKYRAEHVKVASRAGKIGGARGAQKRIERMAADPAFAEEVRAKMSAAAKANWAKRKAQQPL